MELVYTFLKERMLVFCGQMWWRKPEHPGKTTDLGWATTTLSHALTRIQTQTTEVTSECFIHYPIQAPAAMLNSLKAKQPIHMENKEHAYIDLFLPDFHLSLESLYLCNEAHSLRSVGSINRLLFQVCTRLK